MFSHFGWQEALVLLLAGVEAIRWLIAWGQNRTERETALDVRIDGKPSIRTEIERLETGITSIGNELEKLHEKASDFNSDLSSRFGKFELDMRSLLQDLDGRVKRVEQGNDTWTKILRRRSHAANNNFGKIILAIELLKRGQKPPDLILDDGEDRG